MAKEISMKNSPLKIIVDDEDFEFMNQFVWRIIKKRTTYIHPYSTHFGKIVRPHRLILKLSDSKIMVDHINGNPLDNRKENLRICTNKQNSRNIGKRKDKQYTSKYKGVFWNKNSKKFAVKIQTDEKRLFLGYFIDEKKAAQVYNEAAVKYHGEFARLNIIE